MEIAGLTVGAVGLAGLFTSCINCFDLIQIGRSFGDRYGRCLLEIGVLRLPLSRWSAVINQIGPQLTQQDAEMVRTVLSDIINLFHRAENLSFKFKSENTGRKVQVYNDDADLDPETAALCDSLKRIALRRQARTPLLDKAKWALYKHGDFEYLIEHVTRHVESLEAFSATARDLPQQLVREEARELQDQPQLETLEEVAEDTDAAFQAAIAEVIASREGHSYIGNSTSGQAVAQMGDHVASDYRGKMVDSRNLYQDNRASDNARVQYGTRYGGKSVFDS